MILGKNAIQALHLLHDLALRALAHAVGIAQVMHGIALRLKLNALEFAGQEAAAPLAGGHGLLPGLAGKRGVRIFLLANLVALPIVGLLFTLLPAVGPWYPNHFPPAIMQIQCQQDLLQLRSTGFAQGVGIVCFPSCHVLWAGFCSAALWDFRWLRIPVVLFASLVILSTLTTGWHYLIDVLVALLLAAVSLVAARRLEA